MAEETPRTKTWLRLPLTWQTDPLLDALTPEEFRVWFKLYCYAGKQVPEGFIAAQKPRLLALEVAHGDQALLRQTLDTLIELEMLVATPPDSATPGWVFAAWGQHQYDYRRYPSDSPDQVNARMRQYRARQKAARSAGEGADNVTSVTSAVTSEDATVTSGYDGEESENQKENQNQNRDENRTARAQRIPADFQPDEADLVEWLKHKPPADKRSMEFLLQQAVIFTGNMEGLDEHNQPYRSYDWHKSFRKFLMRSIDGTLRPAATANGYRWGAPAPASPYTTEAARTRKPPPN